MIWFVYNVLFAVGYTLLLPRFLARMCRRGGYCKGFMQRLGVYDHRTKARLADRQRIWIHAVSVGEIYVALGFIDGIRAVEPESKFVVTTTTSTGHRVAAKMLSDNDVLLYFPADVPFIVRRVLRLVRPRALLLTENELWPNLLRGARREGVPTVLINGRISCTSYRGYRKIKWFVSRALQLVDLFLVQSELDRSRLLELGADPDRVEVTGSAKYDVVKDDPEATAKARRILDMAGIAETDLVLVGGSTWPGEEKVLLEIYAELKLALPELKLVLVPRHAERRVEVEAELARQGLAHVRRSQLSAGTGGPRADILLVDTTGELNSLYTIASVIFVGKSLTSSGGQNFMEPALPGKPIVVGPHLENFPNVAEDFRKAQAMVQVRDPAGLREALKMLLEDVELRETYGRRARELVERKRGVIAVSVKRIREVWGPAFGGQE